MTLKAYFMKWLLRVCCFYHYYYYFTEEGFCSSVDSFKMNGRTSGFRLGG